MSREPNRTPINIPVEYTKTYGIRAPLSTHFRRVTCEEADCKHYREGWATLIDESTDQGQGQAYWIRNHSGRHFREDRNLRPGLTVFIFEAGQTCFAPHQLRLDRPALFLVKGGDWRGNPSGYRGRQHANADDWLDDLANHQQKLADRKKEG